MSISLTNTAEILGKVDLVLRSIEQLGLKKALAEHSVEAFDFFHFLRAHPQYDDRYQDALKARTELLVDDIITIVDNPDEDVFRARLKVNARQWYASKMSSRKYGDKVDINVHQTVDIGGALAEAAARRKALQANGPAKLLHSCFTDAIDVSQDADNTGIQLPMITDTPSVAVPQTQDASEIEAADILS